MSEETIDFLESEEFENHVLDLMHMTAVNIKEWLTKKILERDKAQRKIGFEGGKRRKIFSII